MCFRIFFYKENRERKALKWLNPSRKTKNSLSSHRKKEFKNQVYWWKAKNSLFSGSIILVGANRSYILSFYEKSENKMHIEWASFEGLLKKKGKRKVGLSKSWGKVRNDLTTYFGWMSASELLVFMVLKIGRKFPFSFLICSQHKVNEFWFVLRWEREKMFEIPGQFFTICLGFLFRPLF